MGEQFVPMKPMGKAPLIGGGNAVDLMSPYKLKLLEFLTADPDVGDEHIREYIQHGIIEEVIVCLSDGEVLDWMKLHPRILHEVWGDHRDLLDDGCGGVRMPNAYEIIHTNICFLVREVLEDQIDPIRYRARLKEGLDYIPKVNS